MAKFKEFLKKEIVFSIACLLALASMALCPPSLDYIGYLDLTTLELLFCLMCAVAGLRHAGVMDSLAKTLVARAKSAKLLALALTALCFFSAMLITNDVALITFVPLTIAVFGSSDKRRLIVTVVMETVAANLGSMATPIGNPQNLFLYSHYALSAGEFFAMVLPFAALCLVLTAAVSAIFKYGTVEKSEDGEKTAVNVRDTAVYAAMFFVCVLTVLKVLSSHICFVIVLLAVLIYNRRILLRVDYFLLLTFVCFFVFVGNISSVAAVQRVVSNLLDGRELIVGALASQVISNVPAAVMLAPFTEKCRGLLLGVNIGGLGTPVASLASLIAYKQYCACQDPDRGAFFKIFLLVNFALLIILLAAACLFFV
ncbi:MAG: citrate transporter [Oscillospiraceae bacterium]|nr:citrate transporter [Oscillospiraceae bacterium]